MSEDIQTVNNVAHLKRIYIFTIIPSTSFPSFHKRYASSLISFHFPCIRTENLITRASPVSNMPLATQEHRASDNNEKKSCWPAGARPRVQTGFLARRRKHRGKKTDGRDTRDYGGEVVRETAVGWEALSPRVGGHTAAPWKKRS